MLQVINCETYGQVQAFVLSPSALLGRVLSTGKVLK